MSPVCCLCAGRAGGSERDSVLQPGNLKLIRILPRPDLSYLGVRSGDGGRPAPKRVFLKQLCDENDVEDEMRYRTCVENEHVLKVAGFTMPARQRSESGQKTSCFKEIHENEDAG